MRTHRLAVNEAELAVVVEALREATAAELLLPGSIQSAREVLDRLDARLPSAIDDHPAGPAAGRLVAGDEILRLLLAREDRYSHAALANEDIGRELSWKPAGTSVRELLEELRRGGWLGARGTGAQRRYELTRKGRGRARALHGAGGAPDSEAAVDEPDELLDLIYADSTPCVVRFDADDRILGIWHRPTVQAAGRLKATRFSELEAMLRADRMIEEPIGSYGTVTVVGERHARERWYAMRPAAFGGPPRLARPHQHVSQVIARREDRACPNCGAVASWLERRASKRWQELRGRGEADCTCASCDVRWTIYLERTDHSGHYDPLGERTVCRPRWRYRAGWLRGDALAPPDHHPTVACL